MTTRNRKYTPNRRIPLESDLGSENHEVYGNAVAQCGSGDPTSCIQNRKCMIGGECFEYVPTEMTEADSIIHDLRSSLESARVRENLVIASIEGKIMTLGHHYRQAVAQGHANRAWAYNFALKEFKSLLKTLNPVDEQ